MNRTIKGANLALHSLMKTPLALSSLSAGEPTEINDDFELLDVNEIITAGREGIVCYRVTGESMSDAIRCGDFVFVDPYREPQTGDVIVCYINGKYTIKTYARSAAGLFLVPKNPDFVPRQVTSVDDFHILGVVLWHLGRDK